MTILAGIDIGGTKCAVSVGRQSGENIEIIGKLQIPTASTPEQTIEQLIVLLRELLSANQIAAPAAIGISCGGPLDSTQGLLLSPPNLTGWDRIEITKPFRELFGVPVALQNDANACALAEWRWGAGKGYSNMIFLTFGTGMGAGLILGGKLYSGTNDMAGEVGHIRMAPYGPVGYGKMGSFEGFCSGGGIAQLASSLALERLQQGIPPAYCPRKEDLSLVTALSVGLAANDGDETAIEVITICAEQLGRGLAMLIDLLNPEAIVIGSIYGRLQHLLETTMHQTLKREALQASLGVCRILPAELGDRVGDYAGLSVALHALDQH